MSKIIRREGSQFRLDLAYFYLSNRPPGLNIITDEAEVPCMAWNGTYDKFGSYPGGTDISLYFPRGLGFEAQPPGESGLFGYNPEGSQAKKPWHRMRWRAANLFEDTVTENPQIKAASTRDYIATLFSKSIGRIETIVLALITGLIVFFLTEYGK